MTLGPNEPTHDPITRRPTAAFIREKARDCVAYGWTARPGTWSSEIIWTDEDTETYMGEYHAAIAKTEGR